MRKSLLALMGLAAAGCPRGAPLEIPEADLPVTRAVLYQNGVGYFERRGQVRGDAVTLRIRPDQIADVLKSLTVVDMAKGRAVSVALPIEKSRGRALADLPEQVRSSGGLVAIAAAFRGARAEVVVEETAERGRIVGIEEVTVAGKSEVRLTLLVGGTLKSLPVAAIRALRVLDRTLEVGLERALDVSLDAASWKPVELVLRLAGDSPHDVLISYVVEMPAWKPAYRLVLEGDKALVQGWAMVDNVSGEDWRAVRLSLAAGTPLTFLYDLYTPRFVRRPDLSPVGEAMAEGPPPPAEPAPAPIVTREEADASGAGGDWEMEKKERSRDRGPMAPRTTAAAPARAGRWRRPRRPRPRP